MNVIDNNTCSFCHAETENLIQLFVIPSQRFLEQFYNLNLMNTTSFLFSLQLKQIKISI